MATDTTIDIPTAVKRDSTMPVDASGLWLDRDWAKSAFLVSDSELDTTKDKYDIINRYWTTANNKFEDTRLGGSIGVNARPSFTRYSDVRVPGRLAGRNPVSIANVGGNHGLGRYYDEAIGSNSQTIYLRMGVPQFNSIMAFFTKAFNMDTVTLARTGRAMSIAYDIGKVVGTAFLAVSFPALAATMIAGKLIDVFFSKPTSKFYTLKPTMHTYWSAVNQIVRSLAINKGIMPRVLTPDSTDQKIQNPYSLDKDFMDNLHRMMPDIFTDQYGYNVFAIANRAQRVANKLFQEDYEKMDNGSATDFTGVVKKQNQEKVYDNEKRMNSLFDYINWYMLGKEGSANKYYNKDDTTSTKNEIGPKPDGAPAEKSKGKQFREFFDAEFRQGSQFAVFKVDHTGTVQESFANSAVESDLSSKFNSTSSQVRSARFSLADGNIMDGAVGGMVQGAVGAVKDVMSGALDAVTGNLFSALAGLAGSGFIDIPKHWQSSQVQLPKSTYTMQLVSPYGNPISQMQNIFIPLAMIMAAAMPLSGGPQAYCSPFLVQLYDRGRCQSQLGMIETLQIARGTTNLPFTNRGQVLSIDVTFTVMDLSSIMHMPITNDSIFKSDATMDEDNILMDYLAVLAGQDLYSQFYTIPKAKLRLARKIQQFDKLTSPAYWASLIHQETTTGMMSYIFPGNAIEALTGVGAIPPRG